MTGKVFGGKYRITGLIGSGGMANVYKAVQLNGPHRTVAVKVLKEEYENDQAFVRRFQQEAQAVLSLNHDNIVRSYDVGEEDGHHYIVLEYVEGSTIKQRIGEQGAMPPRQAIQLAVQILDALAHAHECGIIHRDVKPQNVIVTPRGKAKLADFGIARDASSSTMTFAGTNVLGSVHYLSPEQAKGQAVTVESDIYSMGVTLYEMVTGQVPFKGETAVSIALQHLQQPFPAPSQCNPQVPKALNDIILKAVRKDPAHRYHSAKAMRQDLLLALREPDGSFVAREDGDTQEVPALRQGREKTRKNRGVLRIGIIVMIALGMFAVMFLMGRTLLERGRATNGDLVPTLEGKSLEEAIDIAQRKGYTLEVSDTQQTDEYEPGVVISQKPVASTQLKPGSSISVVVSEGVDMPIIPDLTGMTLEEAQQALEELGLELAEPEYRIYEAPVGTIYQQDPQKDTQVLQGDTVRVFISGEPSQNIEMPTVTGLPLPEALQLLKQRGFSSFRVRYDYPQDDMDEGDVFLQSPATGELAQGIATVTLSVCNVLPAAYSAEAVLSLDIAQDATQVVAVIRQEAEGIAYERILYEATLDAGQGQEVAFTAFCNSGGEQEMLIYVGGDLVRKTPMIFTYNG